MTKELATEDDFNFHSLPYSVIILAQGCDTPRELSVELELEDEVPELTRGQMRGLLAFAAKERNLDQVATAPDSNDFLDQKITKQLNYEIDRIVEENKNLSKISHADPTKKFKSQATGEVMTPLEARGRVRSNISHLLEIRKSLTEQAKSKAPVDSNAVNLNIDLGNLVSSTLQNIKTSESFIDME